uniref:Putative secreted protein n=1 Tax=Ixodes ricinus TaxID=34613 RepID=A0A6B0UV66_IXORI
MAPMATSVTALFWLRSSSSRRGRPDTAQMPSFVRLRNDPARCSTRRALRFWQSRSTSWSVIWRQSLTESSARRRHLVATLVSPVEVTPEQPRSTSFRRRAPAMWKHWPLSLYTSVRSKCSRCLHRWSSHHSPFSPTSKHLFINTVFSLGHF